MASTPLPLGAALAASVLFTLGGCALGPGGPFAEVSAGFEARFARPTDREVDGVWQRLNTDYQVRLTGFRVEVAPIALIAAGGAAAVFDPLHPPPGYTLCHGGHCDREDGAQVAYEEVARELSGGAKGSTPVLKLSAPGVRNLLAPELTPLECEEDCELPRTEVTRLTSILRSVELAGVVRDARPTPRLNERAFTFRHAHEPLPLSGPMDLGADRRQPPAVELDVSFAPGPDLFDDLDWAALAVQSPDLKLESAAGEELERRLAGVPLTASIRRSHHRSPP